MQEISYTENNARIMELIRKMDRFAGFSDNDLQTLLKAGSLQDYEAGETILKEGDFGSAVFLLLRGALEISKAGIKVGGLTRNGDVFGEIAFLDGQVRSATITTSERSLILAIDGSSFERRFSAHDLLSHCLIYRVFLEVVTSRLRDMTRENISLVQENERLQDELERKSDRLEQVPAN